MEREKSLPASKFVLLEYSLEKVAAKVNVVFLNIASPMKEAPVKSTSDSNVVFAESKSEKCANELNVAFLNVAFPLKKTAGKICVPLENGLR